MLAQPMALGPVLQLDARAPDESAVPGQHRRNRRAHPTWCGKGKGFHDVISRELKN